MNAETFEKIRLCYETKGIQVSRAWPIWGLNPFDTFTITEGNQRTEYREKAFLREAKRRGCYHIPTITRHLEITENIQAQETLLCDELGWTREELKATLESLAENDAIALITTAAGRRISLADGTSHITTERERQLFGQLETHLGHA